jgi:hypothetical protein
VIATQNGDACVSPLRMKSIDVTFFSDFGFFQVVK